MSNVDEMGTVGEQSERRLMPRHRTFEQHGVTSARIRPGHDVALIDVSASGALVETAHQLRPGSSIEVQMTSGERRLAVRGSVLRCSVSQLLASGICYRGAIAFDRHHPWFGPRAESGYQVPGAEWRSGRHRREDASHPVL